MAELFDIARYEFDESTNISITSGGALQSVASISLTASAGTYLIGYSFELNIVTKSQDVFFQLNGTYGDAQEFSLQAESASALKNRYYAFPKVHPGGTLTVGLSMRGSGTNFTVVFADAFFQRVA